MVWKWIYNEKMGILNSAIRALGGKGIGWLTDPKIALYSVMIVGLWMSVGYNMIILLAGMQGISKSYYEAAQIDGAGPIQLFFKVTIPLLTPTIFFVMITSIISGFQVFDVIYMMIGKRIRHMQIRRRLLCYSTVRHLIMDTKAMQQQFQF